MIYDKEKLLHVYDQTVAEKPRKNPAITDRASTGGQSKEVSQPTAKPRF